jgi:DNA-binding NtrC family response regulator
LKEKSEDTRTGDRHMVVVMICESVPSLLSSFQQTLSSKYSVIAVDSGRECLSKYIDEKAKGNQIDVLVVDYQLQDLPGDIIASTVRELSGNKKPATNTVLICGREVDKNLIDDLKSKEYIIESLEKPVSTDSLLKVIERAVS